MYYFVPKFGGGAALVQQCGLAYAFERSPETIECGRSDGPDGLTGTVLTALETRDLPRIAWQRLEPATGDVWFGWAAADRPGPQTLARQDVLMVGWAAVRLADGREWNVPLVCECRERDPQRRGTLPGVARRRLDGAMAFVPEPDVDALRFDVSRVLERPLTEAELIELAARILGIGYRVRTAEVAALGLLTQKTAYAVLLAAIDYHERVAAAALRAEPTAVGALIAAVGNEFGVGADVAGRAAVELARESEPEQRE